MECLKPKYLSKIEMVVPCGKCPFCAATLRSDWATRLHYEAKLHYGSKFVTLTYSDWNLTWKNGVPQLSKPDLQLWFKRVRKAGYKMRYYAVGEYGATTYRPHYHVIVFGDVPESVLREAWSYSAPPRGKRRGPIGHVHCGSVTQASINYCLGYVVNGKSWKMKHGRVGPFTVMSRRPGLGANYLTKAMIAWHRSDRKNYVILDGCKRHLPRYYKTKIFSKIDLVRIAVRDQKAVFQRLLAFIRAPKRRLWKDPLGQYELRRKKAARAIRFKCKENLTI